MGSCRRSLSPTRVSVSMLMFSRHDGSKGVDLAVRLVEDELKSAMSLPGYVLHNFLDVVPNIRFQMQDYQGY